MPVKPKKAVKKSELEDKVSEVEVGRITHFFDKINVAVVELVSSLKKGDRVRIKGNTTDFEQKIESMQLEHEKIEKASKGQAIGLKVNGAVKVHDKVYIIK